MSSHIQKQDYVPALHSGPVDVIWCKQTSQIIVFSPEETVIPFFNKTENTVQSPGCAKSNCNAKQCLAILNNAKHAKLPSEEL